MEKALGGDANIARWL